MKNNPNTTNGLSHNLTRRDFLKLGAVTFGVAATSGILAGCDKPSAPGNTDANNPVETPDPVDTERLDIDIQSGEHVWQPGELDFGGRAIVLEAYPPEAYEGWKTIENHDGRFSLLAPKDFELLYPGDMPADSTTQKAGAVMFSNIYPYRSYEDCMIIPHKTRDGVNIEPPYSRDSGIHIEEVSTGGADKVTLSWNTFNTPNANGKYQQAILDDRPFNYAIVALRDPGSEYFIYMTFTGPHQATVDEEPYPGTVAPKQECRELDEVMKIIASIKFN